MFLTGARISEALSLTWNVVDLGQSQAKISQTKTGSGASRASAAGPDLSFGKYPGS